MNQPQFDVFLCHNSKEKPLVERIRNQLRQYGIYAWLDKYDFEPFKPWQDQLEAIIPQINAVAIFIGSSGVGPWANIEMREFLVEFAQRKIRMGLVILPDCSEELIHSVPRFMRGFHWVDFREAEPDPMEQLYWGITGRRLAPNQVIQANAIQSDDLSSEKGVDYTRLRDLLAVGNWKAADYETNLVMLQAVGRKKNDWIRNEELLNFPCTDLRTIDQLWVKYSNGRFGFSVQKKIYLTVGGKPDGNYDLEAWEKLGDHVGWRVDKSWILYNEVTFDTSAPVGHLPSPPLTSIFGIYFKPDRCWVLSLLSRSDL